MMLMLTFRPAGPGGPGGPEGINQISTPEFIEDSWSYITWWSCGALNESGGKCISIKSRS